MEAGADAAVRSYVQLVNSHAQDGSGLGRYGNDFVVPGA